MNGLLFVAWLYVTSLFPVGYVNGLLFVTWLFSCNLAEVLSFEMTEQLCESPVFQFVVGTSTAFCLDDVISL